MLMFLGDSHSRQFQTELPGQWSYVSFSGATIKGLASLQSQLRHGETIKHLVATPFNKTVFIMFGAVDLDVTFYRKAAMGEDMDEQAFFEGRADIYRDYLDRLHWSAQKFVRHICVLAPQPTPLRDAAFVGATAKMAKLDEEEMVRAIDRVDCAHEARCRRQLLFNDIMQQKLGTSADRTFHRIDHAMITDGVVADRFVRRDPREHHSDPKATLPLWQMELQAYVPRYKSAVERRARRLEESQKTRN